MFQNLSISFFNLITFLWKYFFFLINICKYKSPKGFVPSMIDELVYKHLPLDLFYEVKWSQLVYNLKFKCQSERGRSDYKYEAWVFIGSQLLSYSNVVLRCVNLLGDS